MTEEYFHYQNKYNKKYRNNVIVLMQIGSFHEAYGTDEPGFILDDISFLLNIIKTKKSKKIEEVSKKHPYMMGFPSVSLKKYMDVLINNNYTVIVVDQTSPPPSPRREVTGIYSKGTYLDESFSPDSNNIVSIYIEDEPQRFGNPLICVGLSVIDLSTGVNTIHEAISLKNDNKYALDEAVRFINSFNPTEIIINRKRNKNKYIMTKNKLIQYLELDNKSKSSYNYNGFVKKEFHKINFQNNFFKKIFSDMGMNNAITYLNLELKPYATISYIYLLEFAKEHNENLIKNIDYPQIFQQQKHLTLANDAIFQLNVFENNQQSGYNKRIKSLFDVLNKTSTPMGKRTLRNNLANPLINKKTLQTRYNDITYCLKDNLHTHLENELKNIVDIERLHRKLSIKLLHPFEFTKLLNSYTHITKLTTLTMGFTKTTPLSPSHTKRLTKFTKRCNKIFNTTEMQKYSTNDISKSFFNKGVYKKIDKVQNKIDNHMNFMTTACITLSKYIYDKSKKKASKASNTVKIQLKYNERQGFYLLMTKLRSISLQTNLKNVDVVQIGQTSIATESLIFKLMPNRTSVKLTFPQLHTISDELSLLKYTIMTYCKEEYMKLLTTFQHQYGTMFKAIDKYVAHIDFIKSGAKVASTFNYCKPTIISSATHNSFIRCKQIRHPIIERILVDTEYIPCKSISLGKWKKDNYKSGMLIYGANCSGKSSLTKAIALNVIMAQIGYFTSCSEFKFSPYHSLFARIRACDNIFKGLSSFALEMQELKAIITRSTKNSLIVGDEICKGSEITSAQSIVAATIIHLESQQSSFVFASHLHKISTMPQIKQLTHVKSYHLSVSYDKEHGLLVFDRRLKLGVGNVLYGVDIARYIINDNKFMKIVQEIKNDIVGESNTIMEINKSKYNSSVYVNDCQICGAKKDPNNELGGMDVHHIKFQSQCVNGFVKDAPHVLKNAKSNLVVVCKKCHNAIHANKIKVTGYISTSNGVKLNYTQ